MKTQYEIGTAPVDYPPDVLDEFGDSTERLHLNEAPYQPAPAVRKALENVKLQRYPDATFTELIQTIADFNSVEPWQVTVGNGSHELINLASLSFQNLAEVVVPTPTFYGHPKSVQMAGGTVISVPVDEKGSCDLQTMSAEITEKTSALVVVTPNNPTGGANSEDQLRNFLASVPENILVIIDEAYAEFSVESGGPDVLSILRDYTMPWLLLRTFSKAYALAGLRLGYGMSNKAELINQINYFRGTFRISGIAAELGCVAIQQHDYVEEQVRQLIKDRDHLRKNLIALGLEVPTSYTNFLVIRRLVTADQLVGSMRKNGILVSTFTEGDDETSVRVTVGNCTQNRQILRLVEEHLS